MEDVRHPACFLASTCSAPSVTRPSSRHAVWEEPCGLRSWASLDIMSDQRQPSSPQAWAEAPRRSADSLW